MTKRAAAGRLAALCFGLLMFVSVIPATASARDHLLGTARLTPSRGGTVTARDGWRLDVPPHVVRRSARGTITALSRGRVAITIHAPWHGAVEITAPLSGGNDLLAHDVGGLWIPEGTQAGQRTVWVTRLSLFSTLGTLVADAREALCVTSFDPEDFLGCLALRGLQYVDQRAAQYLAGKVSKACLTQLLVSALYVRSAGRIPIAALKDALSKCKATTSSPGASGPSTLPVSGSPVSGSGLQGPTVNPQESTETPQPESPLPPAPPPPPPSQSISIGWSGGHSGWIWMTIDGFAAGAHPYTCSFGSGGDATFTLVETVSPETWDNGHTCYDRIGGDTVWVTIGGVTSNVIVVP
jgi:hypothetical protein